MFRTPVPFFKKICHFKQNYQMITLKLAKINEIVHLEKCRSFLSDKCNLIRNLIISKHQGKSNKTVHKWHIRLGGKVLLYPFSLLFFFLPIIMLILVKIDHWHCKIAVVNFLITYAIETIYGETIFYHIWWKNKINF